MRFEPDTEVTSFALFNWEFEIHNFDMLFILNSKFLILFVISVLSYQARLVIKMLRTKVVGF